MVATHPDANPDEGDVRRGQRLAVLGASQGHAVLLDGALGHCRRLLSTELEALQLDGVLFLGDVGVGVLAVDVRGRG